MSRCRQSAAAASVKRTAARDDVPTPDRVAHMGAHGRLHGASTLVVDYGIKAATVTRRGEDRQPR